MEGKGGGKRRRTRRPSHIILVVRTFNLISRPRRFTRNKPHTVRSKLVLAIYVAKRIYAENSFTGVCLSVSGEGVKIPGSSCTFFVLYPACYYPSLS